MTKKAEKMIERCANIEPLEGRVIILLDKIRTYKDKQFVPKPKDPKAKLVIGDDGMERYPEDVEMIVVEEMKEVNHRFQTATVIKAPEDETRFKTGDTIVYQIGATNEFDLIKGASLIRKYDVLAVVKS